MRRLGQGRAVFARVRSPEVYSFHIPHDGLSTSNSLRKRRYDLNLVSKPFELGAHRLRHSRLDLDIAAFKRQLGKSWSFEAGLNVHPVIDHVGYELRVGLRLVPTSHNAEGNPPYLPST